MGAYGQYGTAPGQPPAQPQYGAVAAPGATPGAGYGYGELCYEYYIPLNLKSFQLGHVRLCIAKSNM